MKRIETLRGAVWIVILGLGLLFAPGLAHAQGGNNEDIPELGRDWNLRIGVFVPQSQTARAVIGSVGFSGTVERTVYQTSQYDINVGIGYNGFGNAYSIPIMGWFIGHMHNLRYGGGAGYSFNRKLNGGGSNDAVLGLLLGYQLTHGGNGLTLDLRYNFVAGTSQQLDGYSLTLGIRF